MRPPLDEHPLLRALTAVGEALDDVADLDPAFVPSSDKARARWSGSTASWHGSRGFGCG